MRPIDADALLEDIKSYFGDCIDEHDSEIIDAYCNAILIHNKNISKIIKEAPTVERPKGEWINEGQLHGCSNCGKYSKEYDKPFCCHCGADMRGEEE